MEPLLRKLWKGLGGLLGREGDEAVAVDEEVTRLNEKLLEVYRKVEKEVNVVPGSVLNQEEAAGKITRFLEEVVGYQKFVSPPIPEQPLNSPKCVLAYIQSLEKQLKGINIIQPYHRLGYHQTTLWLSEQPPTSQEVAACLMAGRSSEEG